MKNYTLSEDLITSIHTILNELPAKNVRGILNKFDQELSPQIKASSEVKKEEEKVDKKKEKE